MAMVVGFGRKEGGPVELERTPKMVRQLEAEAKQDVESDVTVAGLKRLSARDSLAATLTGGLKRQLENMQHGDASLLKNIEAKATKGAKAKVKMAATKKAVAAATAAKHDQPGSAGEQHVAMITVTQAVERDRIHEMHEMRGELEKVAQLQKQVQERSRKEHDEVKDVIGKDSGSSQKKKILQIATAKALKVKAAALEKKAKEVKHAALVKNFKDYSKLEAAENKQRGVLNKLKTLQKLMKDKNKYHEEMREAKQLSAQAIQELKQAGDQIKASKLMPQNKEASKLQKHSEDTTEKAVHDMLKSRRMSHKASDDLKEANAAETQLPALESKAREAKLVLKVLQAQQKTLEGEEAADPNYQKVKKLSAHMLKLAAKDRLIAKGLMHKEEKAQDRVATKVKKARKDTERQIEEDRVTAGELKALHSKLAAQKEFIEKDDAILGALKPSS